VVCSLQISQYNENYLLSPVSQFLRFQAIHILLHSKSILEVGEGLEEGRGSDCYDVTNLMAAGPFAAPSRIYLGFLLHIGRLVTTFMSSLIIQAKGWEGFFWGSFAAN
jgi:hypothetical protein